MDGSSAVVDVYKRQVWLSWTQVGHMAAKCRKGDNRAEDKVCNNCGNKGHFAKDSTLQVPVNDTPLPPSPFKEYEYLGHSILLFFHCGRIFVQIDMF